jgi:hypothetical protein
MWYWLDGLINSNLLEQGVLSSIRVAGFLMGLLIGSAALTGRSRRFAWLVVVFIGAVCTKLLITFFEWQELYTWEIAKGSSLFFTFCILLFGITLGLVVYLVSRNKKSGRRRW